MTLFRHMLYVYNYLLDCIAHSFIDNLHIKVELRVVAWLGLVAHENRGLENLNDFDYNWLLLQETIVILVLFRMM